MAKPRDGFKARLVELPVEVWAGLDGLQEQTGVPMVVLLEDAVRRYTAKPPARLPAPRKRGRKPKPPTPEVAG